jgi:hypothetical protein
MAFRTRNRLRLRGRDERIGSLHGSFQGEERVPERVSAGIDLYPIST